MKLAVTIPLCDYESITTVNWHRDATYQIVKACLESFRRNINSPLDLYILADRCSDRFIYMAEKNLSRFNPIVIDNSNIGYGLSNTSLREKNQHIVNQFVKSIELSAGHDILYFCEQDYVFKKNALDEAVAAFNLLEDVNLLSMFDHPDRHKPLKEPEFGKHRYFKIGRIRWKTVSSLNGNWLWRTRFIRDKYDWLISELKEGALDYRITNGLYRQGEKIISPEHSLIQHIRIDGSNASPTYGFCWQLSLAKLIGLPLIYPPKFSNFFAGKR